MNLKKSAIALSFGLAAAAGMTASASAAPWVRHHPARTEILTRAANQRHRIGEERKEGDLTVAQAHRLHAADRAIVHREQVDARANGGHLTRGEVDRLNRAENAVNRHIPE